MGLGPAPAHHRRAMPRAPAHGGGKARGGSPGMCVRFLSGAEPPDRGGPSKARASLAGVSERHASSPHDGPVGPAW